MIIPGSASQAFAAALAAARDDHLVSVTYDEFPDGELRPRLGDVAPEHAVVVAATPTSDAHVETLLLQDAAREAGADRVTTVVPYMGYARQDEAFAPGDPVSARAVARALSANADRVLTVNPHEPGVRDFFEPAAECVDAAGVLADPLPADLEAPVFLSPDSGAVDVAERVRDAYGRGEVDHFEKTRFSGTEVEVTPSDADVADRDVVVTDDIIATGGTMSEAVAILHDEGAARVYLACVHPLLAKNALTRLSNAGVEAIYGTDTIERSVSAVSAAPAVADVL